MDLTFWHLVQAGLGLSFLIFVHELGHFLAAKKVGIRVETFCIGFQPTIFGYRARFFAFTRGGTEYAVGMVPLGGYVKMAGEQPGDAKTGSGDEFTAKTIGERALVLVAGSLMNMVFGFLFFILAFTIGFETESSTIGNVVTSGPAWEAGIRPGDKIVAIDGEPKRDMLEVIMTVALRGPDQPVTLDLQRSTGDGQPEALSVQVTPKVDPVRGMPQIGISPAATWEIGSVDVDSEAAKKGVREGDVIRRVRLVGSGLEFSIPEHTAPNVGWSLINDFVAFESPESMEFEIERKSGVTEQVRIENLSASENKTLPPTLGVSRASRMIVAVQPHSEAANVFQPGWEIVSLGGSPLHHLAPSAVLRAAAGRTIVEFETATGESGQVRTAQLIEWLGNALAVGVGTGEIASLHEESPLLPFGVRKGDHLIRVGDTPITGPRSLESIEAQASSIDVVWWSAESMARREASILATPGTPLRLGVKLDARIRIGSVLAKSAAQAAGLAPGDIVIRANDRDVEEWSDLTEEVAPQTPAPWWTLWWGKPRYEIREVDLVLDRSGTSIALSCTPRQVEPPSTGLRPKGDKVLLKSGVLEASVQGPKRAWVWSMRVFLTLKSLFTGQVAARNLSGPVGILSAGTAASQNGIGYLIFILALISVNLGIFNLLPFPILDGGHLTFLLVEKIKGSPVSERVQEWSFTIAFFMLIGLAIFVTYNDVLRLFGR